MSSVLLRLLCAILFIWQPMNFAAELALTMPSLHFRGPLATLELTADGIVAALSAAAGWSLWIARPHGPALAKLALVGMAAVSVQSQYWSMLPGQTSPGAQLPIALVAVGHSVFWLIYLRRSSAVRRISALDG
jgi:hypothetical protein